MRAPMLVASAIALAAAVGLYVVHAQPRAMVRQCDPAPDGVYVPILSELSRPCRDVVADSDPTRVRLELAFGGIAAAGLATMIALRVRRRDLEPMPVDPGLPR